LSKLKKIAIKIKKDEIMLKNEIRKTNQFKKLAKVKKIK
jgi:hypothetical protein